MSRTAARRPGRWTWIAIGSVVGIAALAGLYYGTLGSNATAGSTPAREFVHIHGLGIDPGQPDVVWLSTHQGLIRITETSGWAYVGKTRPDLMGFTVSPSEPGVLYSSGHPGKGLNLPNPVGLIVSRDGGQTWQPVSLTGQVDFHAMAVSGADPRLIYGWHGELYRSEDGGATWKRSAPAALAEGGHGPFQLAAHPRERRQLLAATAKGLLRSQDLGENWETLLPGTVTAVAYHPAAPDRIVAYQHGKGLLHSADGGRTWKPLGFTADAEDAVSHIAIHPQDARVIYIGTFKQNLLKSTDGGATWEPLAREGKVVSR